MKNNNGLYNASVIGENPREEFIVDGKHLHAVEPQIAAVKKNKNNQVLPLIREALTALIQFSESKVEPHFLEIDLKSIEDKPNEKALLVEKIEQIYSHLPHSDRNHLSSLIHHKSSL